ncbi:hypothetical protein O1611_g8938 [Lasiodiplodia mahajangana]|uniref:Uncharacterized protein n=1 Tax=Lasiodiplodia mahajangana TaxID=1108764 RepID=A0ACC2JB16_9PEZI|nr:hypothetical protein O1611_g8938 [Lasiodiplodia mahajangana]
MKHAPQLKLPSWPPRVLLLNRGRQGAAKDDGDSSIKGSSSDSSITDKLDPEANKSPDMLGSSEPAYQRLPSPGPIKVSRFRRRRIRWALGGFLLGDSSESVIIPLCRWPVHHAMPMQATRDAGRIADSHSRTADASSIWAAIYPYHEP